MRVGVIGLGMIGKGIATCLARENMLSAVCDVRAEAVLGFEGACHIASSPDELARHSDIVVIAVVSAEQICEVLQGVEGLLAAARPGLKIVLVATVSLAALDHIRAVVEPHGATLIDCGVSGGFASERKGLVCLVGAEPDDFAAVAPALEGFARHVAHMGGPGAGMRAKIVRNTIFFGCLRAGLEGARLAQAAGLDLPKLANAINESAQGVGGPMLFMGERERSVADPEEASWREHVLDMTRKDIDAAFDLGRELGIELPLLTTTREMLREVLGLE